MIGSPENIPQWRQAADTAMMGRTSSGDDAPYRALEDHYRSTVLPKQQALWNLALARLVAYGDSRSHDSTFEHHPQETPLSTGLLLLGEPQDDSPIIVPAARLYIGAGVKRTTLKDIRTARTHRRPEKRQEAAMRALNALDSLQGPSFITLEAFMLSDQQEGVPHSVGLRYVRREALYERSMWESKGQFMSDSYLRVALKKRPEVAAWSAPLAAFGDNNKYSIARPHIPDPPVHRANRSIEEQVEEYSAVLAAAAEDSKYTPDALDMVSALREPVRSRLGARLILAQ